MRLKISALGVLVFLFGLSAVAQSPNDKWLPNDMDRPMPPAISISSTGVPSDAVVLFDGSNLNAWVGRGGSAPEWDIKDGALIVKPRTGSIRSEEHTSELQSRRDL